jgi:hypothetical protein
LVLQLHQGIQNVIIGVGAGGFGVGARLGEDLLGAALRLLIDGMAFGPLLGVLAGHLEGSVGLMLGQR